MIEGLGSLEHLDCKVRPEVVNLFHSCHLGAVPQVSNSITSWPEDIVSIALPKLEPSEPPRNPFKNLFSRPNVWKGKIAIVGNIS